MFVNLNTQLRVANARLAANNSNRMHCHRNYHPNSNRICHHANFRPKVRCPALMQSIRAIIDNAQHYAKLQPIKLKI